MSVTEKSRSTNSRTPVPLLEFLMGILRFIFRFILGGPGVASIVARAVLIPFLLLVILAYVAAVSTYYETRGRPLIPTTLTPITPPTGTLPYDLYLLSSQATFQFDEGVVFTRLDENYLQFSIQAKETNAGTISGTLTLNLNPPCAISDTQKTSCHIESLYPGETTTCRFTLQPGTTQDISYSLQVLLDGGHTSTFAGPKSIPVRDIPAEKIFQLLGALSVPLLLFMKDTFISSIKKVIDFLLSSNLSQESPSEKP